MARPPDFKRISKEDFASENQELVGKLAFIINSFHEQVRSALNKSLNTDNLAQEIKELTFTTNESSQPLNNLVFKSGLLSNVVGINVIRLEITSNNQIYPTTMPLISFTQSGELVNINNIAGLEAGLTYKLTLQTIT